jgi:hypothetical protein
MRLELRASHLLNRLFEPLFQPFFVLGIFEIECHELFASGWLRTRILLISASKVARITGIYLFIYLCGPGDLIQRLVQVRQILNH